MFSDEIYMQRCLELAQLGMGKVSPNPLVGCVIVHGNRIIGEGYHEQFGQAHAEVNAIASVKEEDRPLLSSASLYVNLEPCSHHGKTPPCADLLVSKKIRRVVIAMSDPNPLVAGAGIRVLESAGIKVKCGILETQARELNRRFITFMTQHRPYIILKWAQSAEGNFCPSSKKKFWLSGPEARIAVHKWRSEEDAVLVGAGTVISDDPELTVREYCGRNPLRVVFDPDSKLSRSFKVFDGNAETLHFQGPFKTQAMLHELIETLYNKSIQSLIVEGGLHTLNEFISSNLWNEARVIQTPGPLPDGLKAPYLSADPKSVSTLGNDQLLIFKNHIN